VRQTLHPVEGKLGAVLKKRKAEGKSFWMDIVESFPQAAGSRSALAG
jgi:hypothetical protein